ncbi:MAG: hypothetical protein ACYC4R_16360 [Anaerolineae bacterium]
MIEDTLNKIVTHLEFLGFEISHTGEITRATHPKRLNLAIRPLAGGILITAIFGCSATAKRDRRGYMELINGWNNGAAVARFYADKDSDLFLEAWYPDNYDRAAFGTFMDAWEHDCGLLKGEETTKYLQ